MNSTKTMKRNCVLCSGRVWILLLAGVSVCGLTLLSGWPSALYSSYSSESVQAKLQDEVQRFIEPRAHSHKHYHRHSGIFTNVTQTASPVSEKAGGPETLRTEDINKDDGEDEVESVEVKDPKLREYKDLVLQAQNEALRVLDSKSGWNYAKGKSKETDGIVYSMDTSKWGTIYKLEAILDVDAEVLFDDIVYKSQNVPLWNPTMEKVQVLQTIDDSTEVAYSISASALAGVVSSRDFVYTRHWEEEDGWLVTSSVSIHYDKMPPNNLYVRGEQRPGIIRMRTTQGNKAELQWLLNSDIKGWIPSSVVARAMSSTLISYLESLRKHAATLR